MASVRYEKENALGRVTLARASEANRLTFEMMEELTEALLQAGEECDVILLSGEGADFCAGRESVRGGAGLPPVNVIRERFRAIVKMNDALEFSPAVTVAALRGRAYGPGAGLDQPGGHRLGFGYRADRLSRDQGGISAHSGHQPPGEKAEIVATASRWSSRAVR